jgi:hypothetical protein
MREIPTRMSLRSSGLRSLNSIGGNSDRLKLGRQPVGWAGTPSESRDEPRAVTRRRRRPDRAAAATTAAPAPQVHRDEPQTHVAEETPLAPEKVARIDRTRNDDVASQPAEQDGARERRPRITQL